MNHRLYACRTCLDYYTYQFPIKNVMGSKSVDARSISLNLNTDYSAEPKGLVLVVLCYQEQKRKRLLPVSSCAITLLGPP